MLRLSGEGFADAAARMRVSLIDSGGVLAACEVQASNMKTGTIECLTRPTADPLAAAGILCTVRVEVLDEQSATALATTELENGFQMLSEASSPLITATSDSSGSTEGGLLLCLHGERLTLTTQPSPTLSP